MTTEPDTTSEELTSRLVDAQGHPRLLYTVRYAISDLQLQGVDVFVDKFDEQLMFLTVQGESRGDVRRALFMLEYKLLRWKGLREQTYFNDPADYRCFMAELQPDVWLRPTDVSPFAQGKSDLKILEAAMVGALPIVTFGAAYMDWWHTGVLYTTADKQDWATQIAWCLEHREEVKTRARIITEIVLRDRGMSTVKEDWSKVLCSSGK